MNNELLKSSGSTEIWQEAADEINRTLRLVDKDAARKAPSAILTEREAEQQRNAAIDPARQLIVSLQAYQWPAARMQYTLGRIDTDILVLLVERRVLDWQSIFNAKAMYGTADDVAGIHRAAQLAGTTLNLQAALTHAAKPLLVVQGLRHEGNADTVDQLFRMGADPNEGNGQLFLTAVEQGRGDIGRLFAKYGQNGLLNVQSWVDWARQNRRLKLYDDLRKISWDFGRFSAIDHETLLETKPLPDNGGSLRILFNFAAQRVTELLDLPNPKQTVRTEYSFDDYGAAALESARAKLIELGGRPSDIELPLRGKSAVARPAGLGKF